MLTSPVEAAPRQRPAYRSFHAKVRRVERLSPHFTRVTFAGDELTGFGTAGLDQRVKVVLPVPHRGFADFPDGEDWYREWRELPAERRNVFRTYTVRAVRPDAGEVDIDFALHGDLGPASAWATRTTPGDEIIIIGPDELSPDRAVGIDFRPGAVDTVLLAGDETAAPAICAILEQLPPHAAGIAIIEVPSPLDALDVRPPTGWRCAGWPATGQTCTVTDSCRSCATGWRATAPPTLGSPMTRSLRHRRSPRPSRPISMTRRCGTCPKGAASTATAMRGSPEKRR